jgi:hypothetical protein
MFRLIEPSSGQIRVHNIVPVHSVSAHYGIPYCLQNYIDIKDHVLVDVKAVPLQAWSGPEGSRKSRFPDFMTQAQDGDKVVSLTHRSPLPPGKLPGTNFC